MATRKAVVQLAGVILDEDTPLTLAELSRACAVHAEYIVELVQEGIVVPQGDAPQRWRFTGAHMRRARRAVHLQSDLGVNLAGAALAIELLDEIEALRNELQRRARRE